MKTIQVSEKLLQAAKEYLAWLAVPVEPDSEAVEELEEEESENEESTFIDVVSPFLTALAESIVETEQE